MKGVMFMNEYETVLFICVALLTIGACIMYISMHEDIKIYKLIVDNYKSYINHVLDPQIKAIRQLVTDEIINKKEECIDNANGCSMEKCPINASTFKTCKLSENKCEYYTGNGTQEGFQDDWDSIRHWLTRCKRDGAKDYYINKMWDVVQSRTDIIKSDKFSYLPEKRYIIQDHIYDMPGFDPEVKDVCVIVEIDENGRPYYSIRYISNDNLLHIGYSSYKLKTVLMFLKDYFKCKEVSNDE